DCASAKGQDDVAFPQTAELRRAVRFYRDDEHAGVLKTVLVCEPPRDWNGLTCDTEIAAPDSTVAYQARCDEPRRVARDGQAQALRGHDRRGVDADDVARGGHQRAA